MSWVCILLPRLGLDIALRAQPEPHPPTVLLGPGRGQRQPALQSLNAAAHALGLRAGMPLSTAHAMTQGFQVLHTRPEALAQAQQALAGWAYGFSSRVSSRHPQVLLLEIGASLRLLGPWPALEQRLRSELQAMGYLHRMVAAPNPTAARALANVHDGLLLDAQTLPAALHALPLGQAGFAPEVVQALAGMGLRSLQQLEALPRTSVRRRFPAAVLAQLDALHGRQQPHLPEYQPPERFRARLELGFPTTLREALWFPLRRLCTDLALCLTRRDGGVQGFELVFEHEGQAASRLQVGLLNLERDATALFELARCRLERTPLPAVTALHLHADALPPFTPPQTDLFAPRAQNRQSWPQLAERLRARLGEAALCQVSPQPDHRPERAWSRTTPPPPQADPQLRRPGWLLPVPQPLPLPPATLLAGPERLETGWWDEQELRRDYYIAHLQSGQRVWIYRAPGQAHWMLHGWFG